MENKEFYYDSVGKAVSNNSVWISGDNDRSLRIGVSRSFRDPDENRYRNYEDIFEVNEDKLEKINLFSSEIVKHPIVSTSPSKGKNIIVRTSEKIQIVEFRSQSKNFRLDISNVCGNPISDTWFGGNSWSRDERYFCFVAKKIDPKKTSLFGYEKTSMEGTSSSKYDYLDDWGEKYESISNLAIVIVDTINCFAFELQGVLDNMTVGQPIFIPSEEGYVVAYTGWSIGDRRLGMIYCYQRPCAVYLASIPEVLISSIDLPKEVVWEPHHCLTSNENCNLFLARSPRVDSNGKYLAIVGRRTFMDSHNGTMELFVFLRNDESSSSSNSLSSMFKDCKCLLPLIEKPCDDILNGFPGLYCDQLPLFCFHSYASELSVDASTRPFLWVNTLWGCQEVTLKVYADCEQDFTCVSYDCLRHHYGLLQSVVGPSRGDLSELDEITKLPEYQWSDTSNTLLDASKQRWNDCRWFNLTLIGVSGEYLLWNFTSVIHPSRLLLTSLHREKSSWIAVESSVSRVGFSCSRSLSMGIDVTVENKSDFDLQFCRGRFSVRQHSSFVEYYLLMPSISSSSSSSAAAAAASASTSPTSSLPLILVPHGGPHSSFSCQYLPSYHYLVQSLHCGVLLVNYGGSLGCGEAAVKQLCGHIGDYDVSDCIAALDRILDMDMDMEMNMDMNMKMGKVFDRHRVSIVGGSHGGYLAAQCLGLHPDRFAAGCLRNPVTHLSSLVGTSDIPDWCWVESLGSHHLSKQPYEWKDSWNMSDEQRMQLWNTSPLRNIDQVKSPCLIALGAKDRRVHPSQGVEYYHALQSRKIPSRLLIFPDECHAIDGALAEAEHWLAIAQWISQYCKSS